MRGGERCEQQNDQRTTKNRENGGARQVASWGSGGWMGFEHCGDTRGPAQLEFAGRASLGPVRILYHHGLEM